jgi:TFIIF-interacting CTD phosphatase-like protein
MEEKKVTENAAIDKLQAQIDQAKRQKAGLVTQIDDLRESLSHSQKKSRKLLD